MADHELSPNIPETVNDPGADDPVVIIAQGGREYTMTNSLVLSARGIPHQVNMARGTILVLERDSARALDELRCFSEENKNWPPPPNYAQAPPRSDNPPTLLMIGGLAVFYMVTGPWVAASPWFAAGAVDSRAILVQGQWWRLVTALTLHADQVHLVGNCVIGGFMVHLLSTTTGYGMAWLTLVLSAMAGNWLNVVLREGPHLSVGFSTAVFAAIGILCGLQLGWDRSSLVRRLILPLGAGAGLLAMLGTEGKQTDLGAHLFGFGCGIACGVLLRLLHLDRMGDRTRLQQLLFACCLALVALCWILARRAG
jgi:membrane associated rhomboid family serine protease